MLPPVGTTLTRSPNKNTDPVYPGSRFPAYVVYLGKDGAHGVFYAWYILIFFTAMYALNKSFHRAKYKDIDGAKDVYDHKHHDHIVHGFSSRSLAHQFYQEYVNTGVLELLLSAEPEPDERFLVIEGVKPMACKSRKALIMDGLQFRGGLVYCFMGKVEEAWSEFNWYKSRGATHAKYPSRNST